MSTNTIEGYSNGDLVEGSGIFGLHSNDAIVSDGKKIAGVESTALGGSKKRPSSPPPPPPPPPPTTSPTSSVNTTQNDSYSLEELKNLENSISGSMTENIASLFTMLNYNNLLYNKESQIHVESIKKLGKITDLGKTENSQLLDFVENVIINFTTLSHDKLEESISQLPDKYKNDRDILTELYLSLAILNQEFFNESKGLEGSNIQDLTIIIERLSKYIPDILVKTTTLSTDPSYETKYKLMNRVFRKIFKTNETYVSFDIFSGLRPLFEYLKTFRTIEMVVIVLALAFIVSKIFDMFRVKVEV